MGEAPPGAVERHSFLAGVAIVTLKRWGFV